MSISQGEGSIKKTLTIFISIAFLIAVTEITPCLASDSPQYILNITAIDSTGTSVTPVDQVITPTANNASVAFLVTTQIPTGLAIAEQGFRTWTTGTPKVTVTSLTKVFSQQNDDNSTTSKYLIELSVPDIIYSTSVSFAYSMNVTDVEGQPVVNHESNQVYFTVTGVSTPTVPPTFAPTTPTPTRIQGPTVTPTLTPIESPTPTVPEFSGIYWVLVMLLVATAIGLLYRVRGSKRSLLISF